MNFQDIPKLMKPYEAMLDTVPADQVQGLKVAQYFVNVLRQRYEVEAELREQIAYLKGELYGNKNAKETDEQEEAKEGKKTDSEDQQKKQKKRIAKARKKDKRKPVDNQIGQQTARSRIPKGISCNECGGSVADQGLCQKVTEIAFQKMKVIEFIPTTPWSMPMRSYRHCHAKV